MKRSKAIPDPVASPEAPEVPEAPEAATVEATAIDASVVEATATETTEVTEATAVDVEALEAPTVEAAAVVADIDQERTEATTIGSPEGEPTVLAAEAGEEPPAPPVDSAARLESIIESLLFASDRPLTLADLKRLLGERDAKKVTAALEALKARHQDTGIQLAGVAGGFQFRTHPENGVWVSKLVTGRPQRLSRALLETLAIVAYRQPVTRPEIDEIRGVDCGPVLKTLLERGLVRMIGKKEDVGRPILYGTTPEFLRTFSLRDLNELPTLREFHELGAAERAEVEAKSKVDGASRPAAPADASDPAPAAPEPLRDLGELPDEEEDGLMAELERASAAASDAVGPLAEGEATERSPDGPDAS